VNVFGSLTSPSEKRFSCTCTATGRSMLTLQYAGVRNTIAYYNKSTVYTNNDAVHSIVIMQKYNKTGAGKQLSVVNLRKSND